MGIDSPLLVDHFVKDTNAKLEEHVMPSNETPNAHLCRRMISTTTNKQRSNTWDLRFASELDSNLLPFVKVRMLN